MTNKTCNDENRKESVIYVKPVFTYDQIVEIIDERIAVIEKASEVKNASTGKNAKKKKKDQKKK